MKNKRIEVSYGKTINMGNFESIRVDAGISFDIADLDDNERELEEAWCTVEKFVDTKEREIARGRR